MKEKKTKKEEIDDLAPLGGNSDTDTDMDRHELVERMSRAVKEMLTDGKQ